MSATEKRQELSRYFHTADDPASVREVLQRAFRLLHAEFDPLWQSVGSVSSTSWWAAFTQGFHDDYQRFGWRKAFLAMEVTAARRIVEEMESWPAGYQQQPGYLRALAIVEDAP